MTTAFITDTTRWSGHAAAPKQRSFSDRAELASLFIRPGDVVCDLGAGAQTLRQALPPGTGYLPVDCVATLPGTHVADFNDPNFTLPREPFNVLVGLGLLNYIVDLEGFLARLASECEGKFMIFTYDFWKLNERYLKHGVANGIPELEEGVALFSKYVRGLTAVAVMRRRVLFTGALGRSEPAPLMRRSATELLLKYLRPAEYFFIKGLGRRMAPRWAA